MNILSTLQALDRSVEPDESDTFANYQTNLVDHCRAIVVASSEMGMAMNTRPEELGALAKKVASEYSALTASGAYAMALADSGEVRNKPRSDKKHC